MPKKDYHFRVMRAIRLRHMRGRGLHILIPPHGRLNSDPVRIFPLPRTVNKIDLHSISDILV